MQNRVSFSPTFFFFQNRKLRLSARQIVILVRRETHEQPAPQRNASASQHISTTNNQQQETNNNHGSKQRRRYQHHNNNHQPTTNAQSQEQQQQQLLFHQAASQNAHSPTSMPALAHKERSQAVATTAATKVTPHGIKQHGNPVAASGDPVPALPAFSSRTAQPRHAKNRGGPVRAAITAAASTPRGNVDDTHNGHSTLKFRCTDMLRTDSPPATSTATLNTIGTNSTLPTTRHRQQQERRRQPRCKRNYCTNQRARRTYR